MSIKESLDKLGNTTEGVVQTLISKGIKGVKNSGVSCPVARYLQAEGYPAAEVADVSAWGDGTGYVDLPYSVMAFVRAFDHGEYPDLAES